MSQQLTDEDRDWLLRSNGQDAVRKNDEQFGREPEDGEYGTVGRGSVPLLTGNEPSRGADKFTPTGLTADNPADVEKAQRDAQFRAAIEAEAEGDGESDLDSANVNREGVDGIGPYDTWKVEDLRAECERRELSRSGNKPDLVERLRVADQEYDDSE